MRCGPIFRDCTDLKSSIIIHRRCEWTLTQVSWFTWLLSLRLLLLLSRLLRSSLPWHWLSQNVHTTRWARLLTLEPRAEAVGVKYVCARKLLARCRHVLATNYANVITWKYKHVTRKVIRSAITCITEISRDITHLARVQVLD